MRLMLPLNPFTILTTAQRLVTSISITVLRNRRCQQILCIILLPTLAEVRPQLFLGTG